MARKGDWGGEGEAIVSAIMLLAAVAALIFRKTTQVVVNRSRGWENSTIRAMLYRKVVHE